MNDDPKKYFENNGINKEYIRRKLLPKDGIQTKDFEYRVEEIIKPGLGLDSMFYKLTVTLPDQRETNYFVKKMKNANEIKHLYTNLPEDEKVYSENISAEYEGFLLKCVGMVYDIHKMFIIMPYFEGSYDDRLIKLHYEYNEDNKDHIKNKMSLEIMNTLKEIAETDYKLGKAKIKKELLERCKTLSTKELYKKRLEDYIRTGYFLKYSIEKNGDRDTNSIDPEKLSRYVLDVSDWTVKNWGAGVEGELEKLGEYLSDENSRLFVHFDTRTPNIVYNTKKDNNLYIRLIDLKKARLAPFTIDLGIYLSDYLLNRFDFIDFSKQKELFKYGMALHKSLLNKKISLDDLKNLKDEDVGIESIREYELERGLAFSYAWALIKNVGVRSMFQIAHPGKYKDFIGKHPEQDNRLYINCNINKFINNELLELIFPNTQIVLKEILLPELKQSNDDNSNKDDNIITSIKNGIKKTIDHFVS